MHFQLLRNTAALVLATTLGFSACGGDKKRPPSIDRNESPGLDDDNTKDDGPPNRDDVEDAATTPEEADASALDLDGGPNFDRDAAMFAENCGDGIICAGTKACVEDETLAVAFCDCDPGFTRKDLGNNDFECVLDTSCLRLKPLFAGCHQLVGSHPLSTNFFSVEYCAGVPVPAEVVGDPADAFEVLQDEKPLDPTETYVKLVERDVESIVTLALDVSGSVLEAENKGAILTPMVAQLRSFVKKLAQVPGPPVVVTMLVFGRSVEEYIPASTDLVAIDAALAALETEAGQNAVKKLVNIKGTELYAAVKEGIHQTERLQTFRRQVSQNGVLTSGTLVVITDGEDGSGGDPDSALIEKTTVNIVSIGINDEINDLELTAIGKSGSFLAPNPADWGAALDEIAARIQARSGSIYGTLFCSAATTGKHTAQTKFKKATAGESLGCDFDADGFGDDQPGTCKAAVDGSCSALIAPGDGVRRCGGIMACGSECEPGECCNDWGFCTAPAPAADCTGQDALCKPTNDRCTQVSQSPAQFACTVPGGEGEDCTKTPCALNSTYCDSDTKLCVKAFPLDAQCEEAEQCSSLNCKEIGGGISGSKCEPPARQFDECSGDADAICEDGTYCQSECTARELFGCTTDEQCLSGICDTGSKYCLPTATCNFAWDDKVAFP